MIDVEPDTSPSFSEALLGALHEELAALSETYRVPVILHHIEGLSYEQAAAAIGCNAKTFSSNLTRAREKLRKRLTKRGVTLGVTALVTGLSQSASAAELPAGFVASTCQAATAVAAGGSVAGGGLVSAKVAALTDSALKMLFWAKVQTVAAVCAVTVLVAAGGVAVTVPLVLKQEAATTTKMAQEDAQPEVPVQGGRVWAWGGNGTGQLGDGTTNSRAYPTPVAGLDNVMAVSLGETHTVALKSDRTVWTWGCNKYGQLGDGTMNQRSYPAAVSGLAEVTAIAAGGHHTLALMPDGGVWAWGFNRSGQLGIGTTTNSPIPVPVTLPDGTPLAGVMALAAGRFHSVALRNDGSVWAWGENWYGSLGHGTTTSQLNPVPVKLADGTPLTGVTAIAAGACHTVALKADGSVWSWVSYAADSMKLETEPAQVPGLSGVIAIAAGWAHSAALKGDSTVWTWEFNDREKLGIGNAEGSGYPVQVRLPDGSPLSGIIAISDGFLHTVARKDDGTAWIWGGNEVCKFGDGTGAWKTNLVQVRNQEGTALSNVIGIAAGEYHTAVVVGE